MTPPIELLGSYLHLARAAELRRQPLVRDRVLLLAGVIAIQIGLVPIGECCRQLILDQNPGHMVGRWPTLVLGYAEEDLQTLVAQLAKRYSTEHVEQMLVQLGVERGSERSAYFSDGEYAAGLLGQRWEELSERYP